MIIVESITHAKETATGIDLCVCLLSMHIKGPLVALSVLAHTWRHNQAFSWKLDWTVHGAFRATKPVQTSMRFVNCDSISVYQAICAFRPPDHIPDE